MYGALDRKRSSRPRSAVETRVALVVAWLLFLPIWGNALAETPDPVPPSLAAADPLGQTIFRQMPQTGPFVLQPSGIPSPPLADVSSGQGVDPAAWITRQTEAAGPDSPARNPTRERSRPSERLNDTVTLPRIESLPGSGSR